jgi:L-threonylcarbamoyladenylate synthase
MQVVSTKDIDKVVQVLKEGGIVCAPTDTIYGLLADAGNRKAVERLYEFRRPSGRPFIVLIPKVEDALNFDIRMPKLGFPLLSSGLTVIFQKRTTIPTYLTQMEKEPCTAGSNPGHLYNKAYEKVRRTSGSTQCKP